MRITSILFFCIWAAGFVPLFAQEESDDIPVNNDIVLEEIRQTLNKSSLIGEITTPFYLRSNLPDAKRIHIYNYLMDLNKQVRTESNGPSLEFLLYPDHSLVQTDKDRAKRTLSGEVHLVYSGDDDTITNTEILRFSYSDTIPVRVTGKVDADWNGAAFGSKDLHPERNLWQQVGQPAIIAAATGVTVFLLFNIRSN